RRDLEEVGLAASHDSAGKEAVAMQSLELHACVDVAHVKSGHDFRQCHAVAYRQLEDFRFLGEKRIDVLTAGDESGADLERLAGTGRYHDPARVTEIGGKVARARHNAIEVAPKG